MKLKFIYIAFLLSSIFILVSCKATKNEDEDKIRDLEYTIVEDEGLPEVVAAKIESVKAEPFKFSYTDGEDIYIAIGYGEQPTGGYSIQVTDLFETESYIVIRTNLLGPSESDATTTVLTYPYVVVKTTDLDLAVCFR